MLVYKTKRVWFGNDVNHFSQVRISASGNTLVVDPSISVAPGVNIMPVRDVVDS